MQVTLEKTNDLDATIKVEVVEADYAKKVDSDLRELGRTRQIPGFRKGHVPSNISAVSLAATLRATCSTTRSSRR